MNISSNESVPEQANSFRQRFLTVKSSTSGDNEDLKRMIMDKRGIFKWLPVAFENDLVLGSWYLALLGLVRVSYLFSVPLFLYFH